MILKGLGDHVVKQSPTCGEIREILRGTEFSPNIALAIDIRPTVAHYHETFDEIYFVLDGAIVLRLHEPATHVTTEHPLVANELCVIPRGTHHVVSSASSKNRLAVITTPRFDAADEILSDRL